MENVNANEAPAATQQEENNPGVTEFAPAATQEEEQAQNQISPAAEVTPTTEAPAAAEEPVAGIAAPTTGRIVHYLAADADESTHLKPGKLYPAIVVGPYADNPYVVGLHIFGNASGTVYRDAVKPSLDGPKPGLWNWPVLR